MSRPIFDPYSHKAITPCDSNSAGPIDDRARTAKRQCRPGGIMTLRSTMLLVILLALVASPAWGKSFTGQLLRAEGIRAMSVSVDGQVDHFESFTLAIPQEVFNEQLQESYPRVQVRSSTITLLI